MSGCSGRSAVWAPWLARLITSATTRPEKVQYGIDRYTNEVARLYGVMNRRLEGRAYLADEYSIADMASWPWVLLHKNQGQDLNDFPNLKAWFERVGARPAVQKGKALLEEQRGKNTLTNEESRKILFGQK